MEGGGGGAGIVWQFCMFIDTWTPSPLSDKSEYVQSDRLFLSSSHYFPYIKIANVTPKSTQKEKLNSDLKPSKNVFVEVGGKFCIITA